MTRLKRKSRLQREGATPARGTGAGLVVVGGPGNLGHSIFVRAGHETARLLSHELRHVYQYERAGSIAGFLPTYLQQIIEVGYAACPLERDARGHEVTDL